MSELQITFEELRRQIGRYAGVGASGWDSAQTLMIDDSMFNGLRSFYWPVGVSHKWSFLEIDESLTLVAGQHTYILPDRFSGLSSRFCFPAGSNKKPIAPVPAKNIRDWRATENASGDPIYCSIQTKENVEGGRSLIEVTFYPTPSETAVLTYSYNVEPFTPSTNYDDTSPLGGAMHSQTILEACLAAADDVFNPEAGLTEHSNNFQALLASSIENDITLNGDVSEADTWPLDGTTGGVTSLAVTKSQLQRLIGRALNHGPNPKTWSHGQESEVNEVLRTGLRKFYQPVGTKHEWSFLSPVTFVDMVADKWQYDLPEDFSGVINGKITYAPGSSTIYPPIQLKLEEDVRDLLQTEVTSTRPRVAAIRVKASTENTGTRYELLLAPIPSEELQIAIPYSINPEQLGSDQALPMGGQPHAQTIIEACLYAAEVFMKSGNFHQGEFAACLRRSIDHDEMIHAPQTVGYVGDTSDWGHNSMPYTERWVDANPLTTYNGTVPV